jgi:CheY-like chemotaxis protein
VPNIDSREVVNAAPKPTGVTGTTGATCGRAAPAPLKKSAFPSMPMVIADDRSKRQRERLILVIEDDQKFASILYDLAHELDFDCIHASTGAQAIALARETLPSGILLDVGLPDQSGLSVLERLKRDPETRHIPIHVISGDNYMQTALELGAVGYAVKPVAREELVSAVARLEEKLQKRARRVLVVEDDATLRDSIVALLKAEDTEIATAGTMSDALALVSKNTFDCMVMDLMLPDATGYELLEKMTAEGKHPAPPVIVYTGRVLSRDEEQKLRRYSKSIIIKGARSPERLLDEVTLFLHRVEASMPPDQKKLLMQARQRDAVFEGRCILLAEDDVRNIFALSSVLEPLGAKLMIARNGKEALTALEKGDSIDLVLMDLMMPEMDGLTAMREIRKKPEMARLPIIALTAKVMANDRKDCLDAGANDYIPKPIDVDKLISLCRVWMPK